MRHDSPQGERIGFWFHLGFAAMYALAFAWHLKGAREHARDLQTKLKTYTNVHIGAFSDRDPAVGAHIDHCVKTGENFFATRPTLEDLQEENRLERLNGKRSNRDI